MAYSHGQMGDNMMDSGLMASNMEKVNIYHRKKKSSKVFGNRENEHTGYLKLTRQEKKIIELHLEQQTNFQKLKIYTDIFTDNYS